MGRGGVGGGGGARAEGRFSSTSKRRRLRLWKLCASLCVGYSPATRSAMRLYRKKLLGGSRSILFMLNKLDEPMCHADSIRALDGAMPSPRNLHVFSPLISVYT